MFQNNSPLSERLRPNSLDTFIGQDHLTGKNGILRRMLNTKSLPSMILWGPPGVGKTTLANIIANVSKRPFKVLSAISSGVKEVREVIAFAKGRPSTILFIDEIHRFNKTQQDALLGAVEKGIITLIGATTENPSFEVISALLSRCQVYTLKAHSEKELIGLLERAIKDDIVLKTKTIKLEETEALLNLSGGDGRKLLNLLELVTDAESEKKEIVVKNDLVIQLAQRKTILYDKNGEQHYDIVSAFIKSIRGSDPNAALYWLARMIEGGEDVKYIARRLLIAASEDIGLANPTAIVMATNCFQAVNFIGYPEAELILSQTTVYLASSPKSNASYIALKKAKQIVRQEGDLPVPMQIRNAPTKLMKDQGYGKGYQYSHDYQNNFIQQEYLPDKIKGMTFYEPGNNARENEIRKRLKMMWNEKYGY